MFATKRGPRHSHAHLRSQCVKALVPIFSLEDLRVIGTNLFFWKIFHAIRGTMSLVTARWSVCIDLRTARHRVSWNFSCLHLALAGTFLPVLPCHAQNVFHATHVCLERALVETLGLVGVCTLVSREALHVFLLAREPSMLYADVFGWFHVFASSIGMHAH